LLEPQTALAVRLISAGLRFDKLEHKLRVSVLPDKRDRLQAQLDAFSTDLRGAIEDARRRRGLDLHQATGLRSPTGKQLAIHMLVLRRASNIRAWTQRAARLGAPAV
jgi:hypothetical protein